jgi:hypothetical protein
MGQVGLQAALGLGAQRVLTRAPRDGGEHERSESRATEHETSWRLAARRRAAPT